MIDGSNWPTLKHLLEDQRKDYLPAKSFLSLWDVLSIEEAKSDMISASF